VSETTSILQQLPKLKSKELADLLYRKYGRKLLSYAIHTWNTDEDDAWELIYKTLYKVMDNWRKYEFANEEKFSAFVFTVFINLVRNHHRDQAGKKAVLGDTGIDEAAHVAHETPESERETLTESEKMVKLKAVLDTLEDWQRILLLMRSDGRSYAEIAAYVKKPEDQLKVYYQRLKKAIAEKMYGK